MADRDLCNLAPCYLSLQVSRTQQFYLQDVSCYSVSSSALFRPVSDFTGSMDLPVRRPPSATDTGAVFLAKDSTSSGFTFS